MRLINTRTLELELFSDPVTKPYAILSHTWEDDGEVSFQEIQNLSILDLRKKKGFAKIEGICHLAIKANLNYAWVDTCCIDKTSSAELSEAINSMFKWYEGAYVCYVFLADLPQNDDPYNTKYLPDEWAGCKWFTRGWTLQELIAPRKLLFIDRKWHFRGEKVELAKDLEDITSIDRDVLTGSRLLSSVSLAQRMSWAAARETTRKEDLAYCLMGIFDVNMPMLYGEGPKAFLRLQEEILRKTIDLSIFAWKNSKEPTDPLEDHSGVLADSPARFLYSKSMQVTNDQFCFRDEISLTNKGLKITMALQHEYLNAYVMDLHCAQIEDDGTMTEVGIYLIRVLDTYHRYWTHDFASVKLVPGSTPHPVFLAAYLSPSVNSALSSQQQAFKIEIKTSPDIITTPTDLNTGRVVHNIKAVPDIYWYPKEQTFSLGTLSNFKGFVRFDISYKGLSETPGFRAPISGTSQILLLCDLSISDLQISMYSEATLQRLLESQNFIDPFKNIEQYGPLGDPFSLSVLAQGSGEFRASSVYVRTRNNAYNCWVTAYVDVTAVKTYRITINVVAENRELPSSTLRSKASVAN